MTQSSKNHRVGAWVILTMLALSVVWIGTVSRASAASRTPVVYVATGQNFPDALGASAAAAVKGGPVLLVSKTSIPAETAEELRRLAPDVIYVAGGPAAISDTVFNQLKGFAPTVQRVAGANRYSTAVEVSKSAFPVAAGGGTLEARVAALEAQVQELEALLAGVTRNGTTLQFEGVNLQVVNGTGSTGTSNGVGNIIIGYNKPLSGGLSGYRNGSHYLIIGDQHSYTFYGGIVAGLANTSSAANASVLGGGYNTARGIGSMVINGYQNTASAGDAIVLTGAYNTASGDSSAVISGSSNTAGNAHSLVLAGNTNTAQGEYSSVTGGDWNHAYGKYSAVTGGYLNSADGEDSAVTGGREGTASGDFSSVIGGFRNEAHGISSSVVAGAGNLASAYGAAVVGGYTNDADGIDSTVSGGNGQTPEGPSSTPYRTYPYCGCSP